MPPHLHLAGGAARRLRAVLPGLVGLAPVVLRAEAAPPPVCGQQHRAPVLLLVHFQDPRPVREGVGEALPRDWPRATPVHQVSMEGGVWQWQKHWHRVFLCPAGANGHHSSLRHSPVTLWGLLGSESGAPGHRQGCRAEGGFPITASSPCLVLVSPSASQSSPDSQSPSLLTNPTSPETTKLLLSPALSPYGTPGPHCPSHTSSPSFQPQLQQLPQKPF